MKKVIVSVLLFNTYIGYSQIATCTVNPNSIDEKNLKNVAITSPPFTNSFVVSTAKGPTFATSLKIRLIDSKTLTQQKEIDVPSYNGFDNLSTGFGIVTTKQNIAMFYDKKDENIKKRRNLYVVKMNESLIPPAQPDYLFGATDIKEPEVTGSEWFKFITNENKDLAALYYITESKKKDFKNLHYRLYDNNFKLLKADSIMNNYQNADTNRVLIYNNGIAAVTKKDNQCNVSLYDSKSNKSFKITLQGKKCSLYLEKIKALASGKLILFGLFTTQDSKNGLQNGIFKITYNPAKQTIDEEIYADRIPKGKQEEAKKRKVDVTFISDNGSCYMGYYQIFKEYADGSTVGHYEKYELMGISSTAEKWQKQLPVNDGWMNFISENAFILNKENLYMILPGGKSIGSKIDCNNYTYGSPSPDPASSGYEEYFGHTTALKILPNGTITPQVFND
ncbi:MAG TPA: hypothetical protein VF411_06655, partial [Bacteroidia bacterium]